MSRVNRRSWLKRLAMKARDVIGTVVRVLYIVGCVAGAAALVLWLIDRPSLRIDAALVPGRYLAVAAAAVLAACVLRYGLKRMATVVVIDSERGRVVRVLSRMPVMLRVGATGVVATALLLLALRPTDGSAADILLDDYTANSPAHATQVLDNLVGAGREAKTAGCKPKFDTSRIESIVWEADADGTSPALAKDLMDELRHLPPLNDRLAAVDAGLKRRRNDRVYVVSGHRGPDVGVQPWPLDPSRVRCTWKTPPEVVGAAAATKPRILRYHYSHEPAMENVLELNLEVPAGTEFPSLMVTLTEKAAEKWKTVVTPPGRSQPWQPSGKDGEAFGRHGDRCCYKVHLPRLGDAMTLKLTGAGWESDVVGVPRFDGASIALGPRVLVFKPVLPELTPLARLRPLATDTKAVGQPPVIFDPPGGLPESGGRPVRLIVGPLPSPPPPDEPTVEVIVTDMAAKNPGPATLYREPAYYATDLNLVWVEPSWATGMPPLGEGIDLAAERHRRVHVVSTKGGRPCGPVLFQRDAANRPGYVTIVVPKLSDSQDWPRQRQQMVAFLLTWAGSLAERNGRSRTAVSGETLVPADGNVLLPTESGPPAERDPLAWQVLGVFRGDLDGRTVEPASNDIGGEVITTASLALMVLLVPAAALAWVRTIRLRYHGV